MKVKTIEFDAIPFLITQLEGFGLKGYLADFVAFISVASFIFISSWLANFIASRYITNTINVLIAKAKPIWSKSIIRFKLIRRIAHLAPAVVLYALSPLFISSEHAFSIGLVNLLKTAFSLYITVSITFIVDALVRTLEGIYNSSKIAEEQHFTIKSYVQVARVLLFLCMVIFVISILLNKSPWSFLTGLGAATTVIVLVFRDSILGFVASVQISSYDIIRVGDWVELPQYSADGDVVEISLNNVKIRNFDKTISIVPTSSILNSGIKNWRGMKDSGGRRIKRSIYIDMTSIRFCDKEMLERFHKIDFIRSYVEKKNELIEEPIDLDQDKKESIRLIQSQQLTNIGIFRKYLEAYLKNNPHIHKNDHTLMVRQGPPSDKGVPIELYIFTNTTNWLLYESIQSDIFDHILAILPMFSLKAFQNVTSRLDIQIDSKHVKA